MTITEIAMLLYWLLAGAMGVGLIHIPPEYMYSDYQNPLVVAWNWSFLPVDIAFALCGLIARFGALPHHRAQALAVVGATLMLCAGIMAISFWALTGDFDPIWWAMNLWLVVLAVWSLTMILKTSDPKAL